MSTILVITDTSFLVNFLVLDQAELLARLPGHPGLGSRAVVSIRWR